MGSQFGILFILLAMQKYQFADGNQMNDSKEEEIPVYRVATVLNYPWVMKSQSGYEGILVDLLDEVATLANFTYNINERPNTEYGRIQYTGGGIQVNGVIGALISNKADLAAADLIISDIRSNVVSFSTPFATTGAQILIRPLEQNSFRNFGLLFVPFSIELWICIVGAPLLTAAVSYVMDRLCQQDGCQLNALQSFHLTLTLFLLKDYHDIRPVSKARRILSMCCRTFSVIIIVTYTASLTGYLLSSSSVPKPVIPFKTFQQMSRQADVQYGGWFEMALNLNDNVQREMNRHISSRYTYYSNIDEAVERVLDIEKPFAAIVEGYDGQRAVNQHCELMLLKEKLFEIEYGIACRKDYQGKLLCSDISTAIGNLKESGKLYDIMDGWWHSSNSTNVCDRLSEDNFVTATHEEILNRNFKAISVLDMLLAFLLLLLGGLTSILVTFVEKKCLRTEPTQMEIQNGLDMDDESDERNTLETSAQET